MKLNINPSEGEYGPTPGDVVLVRGDGAGSKILVFLQKKVRGSANYSHVLINVNWDIWCEAMPGVGVKLLTTQQAFFSKGRTSRNVVMIRPPVGNRFSVNEDDVRRAFGDDGFKAAIAFAEIEVSVRVAMEWLRSALFYVGQRYNFLFLVKKFIGNSTKFCSELVASIMRDRGVVPFSQSTPELLVPCDFEMLSNGASGWSNKTKQLLQYLNYISSTGDKRAAENDRIKDVHLNLMRAEFEGMLRHVKGISQLIELNTVILQISLHSNAAGDVAALANLREMLIEGRKILGEGMMLFGAPWLLGRNGIKGAKSEIKRLKKAIAAGENLVAKIP